MQKIIFDLDHTLFDTRKLRDDVFAALIAVGVSEKKLHATYEQLLLENHGNYDTVLHIKKLLDEGVLTMAQCGAFEEKNAVFDFATYLYGGVVEALISLAQTHELWLLTKGVPRMQGEKVGRSGLDKFFEDRVRVVEKDKVSALVSLGARLGDTFVNDHFEETLAIGAQLPELRLILRKRNDYNYPEEAPRGLTYLEDFDQLVDLI